MAPIRSLYCSPERLKTDMELPALEKSNWLVEKSKYARKRELWIHPPMKFQI